MTTAVVTLVPDRTVQAGDAAPSVETIDACLAVAGDAKTVSGLESSPLPATLTVVGLGVPVETLRGRRIRRVRALCTVDSGDPAFPNSIGVYAFTPAKLGVVSPAILLLSAQPVALGATYTGPWLTYRPTDDARVGGPWSIADLQAVQLGVEWGGGASSLPAVADYLALEVEYYQPGTWPPRRRRRLS